MASHPSLPLYQRSLLWEWLLQWPEVCIILHVVYVRRPFSLCGTLCIAIPEGIMFPQRGCQFDGRMVYVLRQTGVLIERYVCKDCYWQKIETRMLKSSDILPYKLP